MTNTLTFANLTLTDADIFGGISYLADLNTGEEFTVGNTASASVSFVTNVQIPLYTKDNVNGVFTWDQVEDLGGLLTDADEPFAIMEDEESLLIWEDPIISRGTYYVTEVTKDSGMYTVTAYDAMYLLETSIAALSLSFPLTVSAAASAIATYLGCSISGTIYNDTLSVAELDDMTIRQLLSYVAEASGCSVKIDGSGHLCFMYYEDSGITVTASEYIKLEVADYTCSPIDKVVIFSRAGLIQAEAGSGDNVLYIKGDNPFFDNATNTNAATILSLVEDFEYAPVTCDMFEENGIEVGTIVTFGTTPSLVMHMESSESGATASSVGSDTRAEYNKDITDLLNEVTVLAKDTAEVAAETKQHFWFTSTDTGGGAGVHITETTKEDFETTPSGGNLLAKSTGIAVRDGLEELAIFAAYLARIGALTGFHSELSDSGFKISNAGDDIFEVNASGEARTKTFTSTILDAATLVTNRQTTVAMAYGVTYTIKVNNGNAFTVSASSSSNLPSSTTITETGTTTSRKTVFTYAALDSSYYKMTVTQEVTNIYTLSLPKVTRSYTTTYYVPVLSFDGDINIDGSIKVGGHSSAIGTIKNSYLENNDSIGSATGTPVCSISLEAGVWMVTCGVRFTDNSNGYRMANLSPTSGEAACHVSSPPCSGQVTQLRFMRILSLSSTTTYYLNAYQNSGTPLGLPASSVDSGNFIRAVRIA